MTAKQQERERWLQRYCGLFPEPVNEAQWRAGLITFEEFYRSAIKSAENMLAEADSINSIAFDEE